MVELLAAGRKRNPVNLWVINPLGTTLGPKILNLELGKNIGRCFSKAGLREPGCRAARILPLRRLSRFFTAGKESGFGGKREGFCQQG